jgi:hypothetical protein
VNELNICLVKLLPMEFLLLSLAGKLLWLFACGDEKYDLISFSLNRVGQIPKVTERW